MHYHTVSDEEWMKNKDAIVETMGNFQNSVLQPISQREFFIRCLQRENIDLASDRAKFSFLQCVFSKHDEALAIDKKIQYNKDLIFKTECELGKHYEHMQRECRKIQEHWFDLVGVGYNDKKCRLTKEDFKRLDARWAKLNPNEKIED